MKILNQNNQEVETIDLGMVEAGKSKEYLYILYNDKSVDVIDIKVEISNEEVDVLKFPKELKGKEEGTVKLSWVPSINIKRGLKTLIKISGKELYT